MPFMTPQSSRFGKVMSLGRVKFEGSVRHSRRDVKHAVGSCIWSVGERCVLEMFLFISSICL